MDTSVRRVWQLEPRQLTLHNPAWAAFVDMKLLKDLEPLAGELSREPPSAPRRGRTKKTSSR